MRKIILSMIILALVACSRSTSPEEGPSEPSYGTVSCGAENGGSIVLDFVAPNGTTPLVGALVSVGTCRGMTDSSGALEMLNVPEGTHTLTIEKGIFMVDTSVSVQAGQTVDLGKVQLPPDIVKMGVVLGSFDRIEVILARLGFVFDTIPCDSLGDQTYVNSYDYIFFNCGSYCNPSADRLRSFLNSGNKRIYASDWEYIIPEAIDDNAIVFYGEDSNSSPLVGNAGQVTADLHDPDLIEVLGRNTMEINFDLDAWAVMTGAGPTTDVLITGPADVSDSTLTDVPFAVIFPYGQGKVIYTSFHNEAQNTQDMDIILEQMILK